MTNRAALFVRLFGIALVAHVVGNWTQPDLPAALGWVNLAVGAAGVVLALKPDRSILLAASALVIASALLEMPFTGNHWVVAALVAMAILVTGGQEHRLMPAARWILLIFYGFAAFAKLNSGFFDPSVSCAVFYANQSLTSLGLPAMDPASPLADASIWLTVGIELSLPILLALRRTRYFGVLLGTTFHTLISFDLGQHFYDFTSVLLALFFLFVPDETVELIKDAVRRLSSNFPRFLSWSWLSLAILLVVLSVLPSTPASVALLSFLPFAVWIPFSLVWLGVLYWARQPAASLVWRPDLAASLVVGLALLNGLTPYTEIKTAYGFNMYANLVTARGETNHVLMPATSPLRDGYVDPVEILDASDPGLLAYRDRGYLVAFPQFKRYLALHQDVAVTYRRAGTEVALERAGDDPRFSEPGPWWWRFMPLRAIDTNDPPRCQDVFLVAL